ncbi:hypothetical protein ACH429_17785 [Streptomyces pathocidini]|uniref:DUF8175 domain-containing protein n=1 Tax=Streptomyces pathocidini TaxID=1650571 RepID=A0ABW7UTJ0_9ACTN
MSLGDDGYGPEYGGYADPDEDPGRGRQTRTRLPERTGEPYGPGRRPRGGSRPSRSMVTVLGVVVLLIAAIAFTNRGDAGGSSGGGSGTADSPRTQPTSPTGEKPVTTANGSIPADFPKSEQGAQSAAANYAVALVSADMVKPDRRPDIVRHLFVADRVDELDAKFDRAYAKVRDTLGLDADGNAGDGMTYISRTAPVGTKVTKHTGSTSTVEVWCTGAFGIAGVGSTNPVSTDWFTVTLNLQWSGGDWKVSSFSQKEGPTPVDNDGKASTAEEITKAVEEYGGFTYAR